MEEILLIVAIGVISAIVSAASKNKQKQQYDSPPRPHISDIQRALSFFDDGEQQPGPNPPVSENVFQETMPINTQPDVQDFQNRQDVLEYSSSWSSLENLEPSPSLEELPIRNISERDDTELQFFESENAMPYSAAQRSEKIDEPIAAAITKDSQTKEPENISAYTGNRLSLLFGSNDIIRGVVFSEILSRKRR